MSNNITGIIVNLLALYFVLGGLMIILGFRKIGEIIWPIVAVTLALAFFPLLVNSLLQNIFVGISTGWVIGSLCALLLLVGIGLKR